MRKRIFSVLLALVLCLGLMPVMALGAETDGGGELTVLGEYVDWSLDDDGTLTIGCDGDMQDYTYNGTMNVINAPWAFESGKVTRVIIEDGVTRIGENAFRGFRHIASVVIPDSVKTIGQQAFRDCSGLTSVVIPDSVTSVGESAFAGCYDLASAVISRGVTEIAPRMFEGSGLKSIVIPDSVKTIGDYAFAVCVDLTHVTISKNAGSIGYAAFYECISLADVVIPDSVKTIGDYAFGKCSGLSGATLSKSLTQIGAYVFSNSGLTSIVIPEGVASIGTCAFSGCFSLASVTIPVSVKAIYTAAFYECGLQDVYYGGTEKQWNRIEIDISNVNYLLQASIHVTEPSSSPFSDVPEGQWYTDAVLWAVDKDITNGTSDTAFSPGRGCTRGQVATFLWRAYGSAAPSIAANPFTDVKPGDYFCTPVLWAVEYGVTNGTSETTFSPNSTCTRGQVVTFLWRAAGSPEPESADNPFTDVEEKDYFYKPVLWAVENGITNGTSDTTFSPDKTCTRAHVVTFLYRARAVEAEKNGWKAAYLSLLADVYAQEKLSEYFLLYIDQDDIPEMFLWYPGDGYDAILCTYAEDTLLYHLVNTGQMGGVIWIEGSGLFLESSTAGSRYYETVYSLDSGSLDLIVSGYTQSDSLDLENASYYLNDTEVTAEEYKHEIDSVFDREDAMTRSNTMIGNEDALALLYAEFYMRPKTHIA